MGSCVMNKFKGTRAESRRPIGNPLKEARWEMMVGETRAVVVKG